MSHGTFLSGEPAIELRAFAGTPVFRFVIRCEVAQLFDTLPTVECSPVYILAKQQNLRRCTICKFLCSTNASEAAMATDLTPHCWICHQPVGLEDCKIDEHGRAMHEKCYIAKLALKKETPPADPSL